MTSTDDHFTGHCTSKVFGKHVVFKSAQAFKSAQRAQAHPAFLSGTVPAILCVKPMEPADVQLGRAHRFMMRWAYDVKIDVRSDGGPARADDAL